MNYPKKFHFAAPNRGTWSVCFKNSTDFDNLVTKVNSHGSYVRRQVNILNFWKNGNFGLQCWHQFWPNSSPGTSLSNTLRTKLHAWTESSIIVEFMVKLIWQHSLPIGSKGTFKMPPRRLDFCCSKGQKRRLPPETPRLKVREVSQSGFRNISWHPSVPSFSQISWPQLLAPGTLIPQTVTLLR